MMWMLGGWTSWFRCIIELTKTSLTRTWHLDTNVFVNRECEAFVAMLDWASETSINAMVVEDDLRADLPDPAHDDLPPIDVPMDWTREIGPASCSDADLNVAKAAFAELQLTATLSAPDLPSLSEAPSKSAIPTFTAMHHWSRASALGDSYFPFSFKDMGATVGVAFDLVGRKVWQEFHKERTIVDTDVCPFQIHFLIFQQLHASHTQRQSVTVTKQSVQHNAH